MLRRLWCGCHLHSVQITRIDAPSWNVMSCDDGKGFLNFSPEMVYLVHQRLPVIYLQCHRWHYFFSVPLLPGANLHLSITISNKITIPKCYILCEVDYESMPS